MAIKYYTEEWLAALKKAMEADKEYQKKAKDLTYVSQYYILDCPGGTDRCAEWTLEKGVLTDYKLEEKPAPSDWRTMPFDSQKFFMRATASYPTYVRLNKGEITAIQVLMRKMYKIHGPMPKIMAKLGGLNALTAIMGTIPVEY